MNNSSAKHIKPALIWQLAAILLLAGALRFINLSQSDVLTDEGSLGFRALGFLDFLATPYQTTPLEWINNTPWWFHLSFHDHPIGFFILQHFSFALFGPSVFALRLPSAVLGIFTIAVVFFIGKKLSGDACGLLAAGLLAVNDFHVWVSRLGLQEASAIFFTLLAFWVWLQSERQPKYLFLFGLVFGAALLIKIHAIILAPLILLRAVMLQPRLPFFKRKEFYFSVIITLIVTAPYWLYNLLLYAKFGHFDFQLSYLFGQHVDAWQIRPGRVEFPDKTTALKYFFLNLQNTLSPVFLLAAGMSMMHLLVKLFRRGFNNDRGAASFLLAVIPLYFLFLMFIGPAARFLTLLVPWLCLIIAFAVNDAFVGNRQKASARRLKNGFKQTLAGLLVVVFGYELWFCAATNLAPSFGRGENLLYSHLTQLTKPYGYNQLDNALNKILAGKKPAVTLPIVNQNLNKFVAASAAKQRGKPQALMIIYDPRLYGESVLWFLSRRMYYQGWPVLDYDVYAEALQTNGQDFFKQTFGLTDFYYIAPAGNLPLDPSINAQTPPEKLAAFEQNLKQRNADAQILTNTFGQPVFTLYHFQ